jgi:hypothetical protein
VRAVVVLGRFWRKISMSKVRILAKREKRGRKGSVSQGGNGHTLDVALLRELRGEERRGNAAPWKAWKTQKTKASFPLFPPGQRRLYITRKGQKMNPKPNSS